MAGARLPGLPRARPDGPRRWRWWTRRWSRPAGGAGRALPERGAAPRRAAQHRHHPPPRARCSSSGSSATACKRLAPVNLVSRYRWVSGPDGAEVPVRAGRAQACLEGGGYAPEVWRAFDADRRRAARRRRSSGSTPRPRPSSSPPGWRALGVADPVDRAGSSTPHPLAHGVSTRDRALRDCDACHAEDSRLSGRLRGRRLPAGRHPAAAARGARVELCRARSSRRRGRPRAAARSRGRAGRPPRARPLAPGAGPTGSASCSSWPSSLGVARPRPARLVLRRRRRAAPRHAGRASRSTSSAATSGSGTGPWRSPASLLIVTGLEIHGDRGAGRWACRGRWRSTTPSRSS